VICHWDEVGRAGANGVSYDARPNEIYSRGLGLIARLENSITTTARRSSDGVKEKRLYP
jgi:hypothetical protein